MHTFLFCLFVLLLLFNLLFLSVDGVGIYLEPVLPTGNAISFYYLSIPSPPSPTNASGCNCVDAFNNPESQLLAVDPVWKTALLGEECNMHVCTTDKTQRVIYDACIPSCDTTPVDVASTLFWTSHKMSTTDYGQHTAYFVFGEQLQHNQTMYSNSVGSFLPHTSLHVFFEVTILLHVDIRNVTFTQFSMMINECSFHPQMHSHHLEQDQGIYCAGWEFDTGKHTIGLYADNTTCLDLSRGPSIMIVELQIHAETGQFEWGSDSSANLTITNDATRINMQLTNCIIAMSNEYDCEYHGKVTPCVY